MNFHDRLASTIYQWKSESNSDEWLFATFHRDYIDAMSSQSAFDAIPGAITLLVDARNADVLTELLETLLSLARQSGTTEVPVALNAQRSAIEALVAGSDSYSKVKLQELLLYYRLPN